MPQAHTCVQQLTVALTVGLQAALPVLVAALLAGLAVSLVQTLIGYGDAAIGLAFRVAGVAVALAVAGGWTAKVVLAYWHWAWSGLPTLPGGGP